MHAAPQKRRAKPRYPTKLEVQHHPELLRHHLPATWAAHPELATAAAVLLAITLAGCEKAVAPPEAEKPAKPPATEVPSQPPAPIAKVAPVFNHGDGRGAMGCVVVSPPAFLSEEEAWQVIDEELAKAQISLATGPVQINGVSIPHRILATEEQEGRWRTVAKEIPGAANPGIVDRADPERRIAVEFVSGEHYGERGGAIDQSTGARYNFKETAEFLSRQVSLGATDPILFGALYDPAARVEREERKPIEKHEDPSESYGSLNRQSPKIEISIPEPAQPTIQERRDRARAESKRLLRLQVQDFIKWLQAQGAI